MMALLLSVVNKVIYLKKTGINVKLEGGNTQREIAKKFYLQVEMTTGKPIQLAQQQ